MVSDEDYKLEFLSTALHDMTEIVSSYVMLGSKQGAIRIKDKMQKAALQISRLPYSGVAVHEPKMEKSGYRMIVVEKYLMFYRVFEDERKVVFYRVLDGKRDYPTIMKSMTEESSNS